MKKLSVFLLLLVVLTLVACNGDKGDSGSSPEQISYESTEHSGEETSGEEVSFEEESLYEETSEKSDSLESHEEASDETSTEVSEEISEDTSEESVEAPSADNSTTEPIPEDKEPEMIPDLILEPEPDGEYHILHVGESLLLHCEIEGAGIEDAMLMWQVSDRSVISFIGRRVTALKPGYSTVTLSYSNGLKPVSLSFMVIEAEESSVESGEGSQA